MTTSTPGPSDIDYQVPTEPGEIAIFILKELRAAGSWDKATLDRAIELVTSAVPSQDRGSA